MLAPCQDGVGNAGYQESMRAVQDMELAQALEWIIDNNCNLETFRIGNQKPVDMLRILKAVGKNHIKILSEMDPSELKEVYRMIPLEDHGSPQESLRTYLEQYLEEKPDALIYLLRDSGLYVVPSGA